MPAGGRRPVRLALPEGLGPAVICRLLVGSAVPGDRLRAALPRWVGSPVQRASRFSRRAPCTTRCRTRSNSDTKSQRPLLRPGGFSLCRRGTHSLLSAPFPLQPPLLPPSNTIGLLGCLFCRERPSPRRQLPWLRPEYPSRCLRRFRPFGAHLEPSGSLPPASHASQPLRFPPWWPPTFPPAWGLGVVVLYFEVPPPGPPWGGELSPPRPPGRSASPISPHFGRTVSCCATWTAEEHLPSFHPTVTPKAYTLLPSGRLMPGP